MGIVLTEMVASGFITKLCAGLFGTSSLIIAAKNNGAKNKIEREGFVVDSDRRSIPERAISFIKDYFYLIVPGYNLYKSFKTFLKNDKKYAEERKAIYLERERLIPVKEKSQPKTESTDKTSTKQKVQEKSEPEKVETKKVEKKSTPRVESKTQEMSTRVINPFIGLNLEQLVDLKDHYEKIDAGLRSKYERLSSSKASISELNTVAIQAHENKKLYQFVTERINELSNNKAIDEVARLLK